MVVIGAAEWLAPSERAAVRLTEGVRHRNTVPVDELSGWSKRTGRAKLTECWTVDLEELGDLGELGERLAVPLATQVEDPAAGEAAELA
jgi:hypothetical protein